jgi:hypothetical protein
MKKYRNAFLVILYDCEIKRSVTVCDLIANGFCENQDYLVIYNNGPLEIKSETYLDKHNIKLIQSRANNSLAIIYNQFLLSVSATRFVFFDHDTEITSLYIDRVSALAHSNIGLPLIRSHAKYRSPSINNRPLMKTGKVCIRGLDAIGSGLVIGSEVVEILTRQYGKVFDERFLLYGVDTTFFDRCRTCPEITFVVVLPELNHSLSRLENESLSISSFRKIERSAAIGMRMRHYFPLSKSIISIVKYFLVSLFCNRNKHISAKLILKYFVLGKYSR